MLSDEEKKAIHDLKILKSGIGILNCIAGIEKDETDIKAIETILNLIEKQSKEIEELKERYERANKRYLKSLQEKDDKCEKILEYVETEKETDYISKDKIKAKIEELDDLNSPFAQRVINGKEVYLTEMIQNILQSLLEKEE